MEYSLVIPCFNEKENIPHLLKRCSELLLLEKIEIIIVDNGSNDGSGRLLSELLTSYPEIKSLRIDKNIGYGNGIYLGLKSASGRFVGWTHADLQTDPLDFLKAIRCIERSSSIDIFVKGRRLGRPIMDKVFTIGMSMFESIYLKELLWDINAQPTIVSKLFIDSMKDPPKDFSFDLFAYFIAKKMKLEIVRFPVNFPKRQHGISSWNTGFRQRLKFILRTIKYSKAMKDEWK